LRAAVDVGGTFTDVLLYDEAEGTLWSAKVPSDPERPARPFVAGLARVLADAGAEPGQVQALVHLSLIHL